MTSPWVAAENPPYCQIKSFENAVFAEGLKSVLRTCRGESAARRFQGRDADLIELYKKDEWRNRDLLKNLQESVHLFCSLTVDGLSSR